jgi:hypothetical protein
VVVTEVLFLSVPQLVIVPLNVLTHFFINGMGGGAEDDIKNEGIAYCEVIFGMIDFKSYVNASGCGKLQRFFFTDGNAAFSSLNLFGELYVVSVFCLFLALVIARSLQRLPQLSLLKLIVKKKGFFLYFYFFFICLLYIFHFNKYDFFYFSFWE